VVDERTDSEFGGLERRVERDSGDSLRDGEMMIAIR
jgi:hypothetical protein